MAMTFTVTNPPGAGVGPLVLVCVVAEGDTSTVVHLTGELDIATTPLLEAVIAHQVARGHLDVRLNLRELGFCDVRGLHALALVRDRMQAVGGRLVLLHPNDQLQELMSWCAMDDLLHTDTPRPDFVDLSSVRSAPVRSLSGPPD